MNDRVRDEMQWLSADARSRMADIRPPGAEQLLSTTRARPHSVVPRVAAAAVVMAAATMIFFGIDTSGPPNIDVPAGVSALVETLYADGAGGTYVADSIAPFFSDAAVLPDSFVPSDSFMSGVWDEIADP